MVDPERKLTPEEIEAEIRDLNNKAAFAALFLSHVGSARANGVPEDIGVSLEANLDGRDYDITLSFYELDEDQNPKSLVFDLDSNGKRIQQVLARARWITGRPQVYLVESKPLSEEQEFMPDHLAYAARNIIDHFSGRSSEGEGIVGPLRLPEPPGNPAIN